MNTIFAILLSATANFFGEASLSISKKAVALKLESVYGMGFLNALWASGLFLTLNLIRRGFDFSLASPWTFAVNCVLAIFQAWLTVHAITKAARSTYAFIRVGTIPMLLLIDIALGYAVTGYQILGMALLCGTLLMLSINHGLDRRGIIYVIFSAINAAIVTAIYKYDISHGNPVETEQFFYSISFIIFFYVMSSRLRPREHVFSLFKKPLLMLQSATQAVGSLIGSYAYPLATASIIMTADRSASVAWAVISGRVNFKEKHIAIKIFAVFGFIIGLILLTAG